MLFMEYSKEFITYENESNTHKCIVVLFSSQGGFAEKPKINSIDGFSISGSEEFQIKYKQTMTSAQIDFGVNVCHLREGENLFIFFPLTGFWRKCWLQPGLGLVIGNFKIK